jgi:lipopolysaccharide transport system permease protein
LFTLGLGLILSLINGIIRDIGNVLAIVVTFALFLTPVLYAPAPSGLLRDVTRYNPLFYLVSTPRALFLREGTCNWEGFLIVSAVSIILVTVCLVVFHMTETRVTERI